jgi:thymidylate synthase ThyX
MGYFDEDYPGLSRELARIVLPVSNYTEMYWKQNLLNMLHLIHLRRDGHAQDEIRAYAEALFQIIQPLFPLTIEAWEDYVWHGKNMSRMDVDLVKELLVAGSGAGAAFSAMVAAAGSDKAFAESRGMSVRELVEFKEQWGF